MGEGRQVSILKRLRRVLRVLPLAAVGAALLALLTSIPGQVAEASTPPSSKYEVIYPGPAEGTSSPDRTPYRMLFVGASVTDGVGASSPDSAYPSLVATGVARQIHGPVAMSVVARPGALVGTAQSWQVPSGQRMIVVHLATNDFLRGTPLKTYAAGEKHLLQRLHTRSPNATIFCMGTWAGPDDTNRKGTQASAYNAQVQAACKSVNGNYIELGPLFERAALHGDSPRATLAGAHLGFHPNTRGHSRIADAILGHINTDTMLPQVHSMPRAVPTPSPVDQSSVQVPSDLSTA